jgi:Tol biopolymer transport system component
MALVEGGRLSDRIAKRPLDLAEALDVAIQTAQGLQAAHEKGIVHRDIKSANLMISRQGQIKIMDFGIALLTDHARLTQTTTIVGTPGYLSPEQAQRRQADRRSDLWSLGIVIYEMVTGRLPFQADRYEAILHSIIYDAHEPITAVRTGVPMELDRIIAKALAKSPDDRYQHADELLVDLRNLARQIASGLKTPLAPIGAGRQVSARRERILSAALAGVSLLFVLSLVFIGVLLFRGRDPAVDEQVRRFSMPFEQARLVISPDGRRLAYRSEGHLWIRDLNSETPREIPEGKAIGGYSSSAGFYLTWSPDSRELVFAADDELRRVSVVEGGSATTICKLPQPREGGRPVTGAAWSNDAETIFFSTAGKGIYEVPARGGSPKLLWKEEHAEDLFLLDTPMGRAIVFASGDVNEGAGHTIVVRTPNGERRKLLWLDTAWPELVYSPTGHILFRKNPVANASIWAIPFSKETLQAGEPFLVLRSGQGLSLSQEGTLVYLDMGRTSQFLAWRDRAGNLLGRSGERHQIIGHFSLSPDGNRAVVTAADDGPSVPWIYDVQRFVKTRFALGSHTGKSVYIAVWPKPGKEIYYTLQRNAASVEADVFAKSADEAGPARQIPLPDASHAAFGATADGRYLLLVHFTRGGQRVNLAFWRSDSSGKGEMIRFSQESENESAPVLSPNHRYIAYTSTIGGRNDVYVRPFPEGPGRWQISTRGGRAPVWGPDGTELFFASGNMLMRVRVSTSELFNAGTPEPLFEHGLLGSVPEPSVARYAVSPDGKKFLFVESERELAQPVARIVQNWLSEFRRKVNSPN